MRPFPLPPRKGLRQLPELVYLHSVRTTIIFLSDFKAIPLVIIIVIVIVVIVDSSEWSILRSYLVFSHS